MAKRKSREAKKKETSEAVVDASEPSTESTRRKSLPDAESLRAGDVIAGKYQVVDQMGAGSFGRVFQAFRIDLPDHLLAIKILPLDANSSELIRHELTALAAVTHPNIVQLSDHGVETTFAWYTMPWYDSITLQQQLNRRPGKGLTLEEAYRIFLPVAEALVALHEAGFRHQDIKPDNILLAQFGGAKERHPLVIDLGLATQHTKQLAGGTPEFMSPEQAQSLRGDPVHVDERSDVYSLAATLLYTLLDEETRTWLFPKALAEAEQQEVIQQVMDRASVLAVPKTVWLAPLPLVVRAPLRRALSNWLSLVPAARPDAKEFSLALELLGLPDRVYKRVRRGLLVVTCLVALLVPLSWITGSFLDDMSALKERANELLGRQETLTGQRRVLQTQKAQLNEEVAALQSAKRELDEELASLRIRADDEKKTSRTRLKDARVVMKQLQQMVAQLEKDKLLLTEQLASAQAEGAGLTSELSEQRSEQTRLSTQLAALNQVLKDANSRAKLYEAELRTSSERQAELRAQVKTLEQKLRLAKSSGLPPSASASASAP